MMRNFLLTGLAVAGLLLVGCGRPRRVEVTATFSDTLEPTVTNTPVPPPTEEPPPTATSTPIAVATDVPTAAPTEVPPTPLPSATPLPPLPPSTALFFETGATSVSVDGAVSAGGVTSYRLRASAGQAMRATLTATSGSASLNIFGATTRQTLVRSSAGATSWAGRLPSTQDYFIQAVGGGADATFTLTVVIPVRLTFAAGATDLSVNGSVVGNAPLDYAVEASESQLLMADVTPADEFWVTVSSALGTPLLTGSDNQAGVWLALPTTQDYFVRVTPVGSSTDFTLRVRIPARLVFDPGAISKTVQGSVGSGGRVEYVLRAQAGQTMTATVTSGSGDAVLTVTGIDDGQPYQRREVGQSSWSDTLPSTQDYLLGVEVPPDGAGGSYTLVVEVQ